MILSLLSIWFASCVVLASVVNNSQSISVRQNSVAGNSAENILELWRKHDKQFQLGTQKDLVLLLGNTGCGKSTLGLLLTGEDLQAVETVENSGEFLIVDEKHRISRNSTIKSKTIIPELMVDTKTDTSYFDCPGFSDTRSAAHDISVTYFIKKLLNFANSVKLVFLVNYSSVSSGGDRFDFMVLARHVTNLIRNIEKYGNGIALVVTKVHNRYITTDGGKTFHLVDDEKVVETIASFLTQVRIDLETKNTEDNSHKDRQFNNEAIKFIEILLEKKENKYERIGIFRFANQRGSVNDMPLLQTEKNAIDTIVNQNIQFIPKENDDFGYTISVDSKNRIYELIDVMHNRLTADVSSIGDEIEQFYTDQEIRISDIKVLSRKMLLGHQKLSQIQAREPRIFLQQILDTGNPSDIGISINSLKNISNDIDYIEFLTIVSDRTLSTSFQIANELRKTTQYLYNSHKWYGFLIDLHELMYGNNVQKNVREYDATRLINQCSIEENGLKNVNDIDLRQFVNQIDLRIYRDVEDMQVNSFKLKLLITFLQQINNNLTATCTEKKLTVTGHNVKISDVIKINCWHSVKIQEIFALNKLFVDVDINKTGLESQLRIIAPTWEIIGDRQIVLNGKNGQSHAQSHARHGIGPGGNGADGEPGLPGSSAGSFLGIGDRFFNGNRLTIYANGGNGGAGQHGGKAANGTIAQDPPAPKTLHPTNEWRLKGFYFKEISRLKHSKGGGAGFMYVPPPDDYDITYKVHGKNGTAGGNGGNGGAGGNGGQAGNIKIIGFGQNSNISIIRRSGHTGVVGIGMPGAIKMVQRKIITVKYRDTGPNPSILSTETFETPAGENGVDGYNRKSIKLPEASVELLSPSHSINSYKNYVREHLADNIWESDLRNFMENLEENKFIQRLYDALSLVHELQGLESQYFQLRNKISFAPFLRSLLHRIENTEIKSRENKKVLSFLYTSTLSKVCGIMNNSNQNLTVDLHKYLDLVRYEIEKLRTISSAVAINEHRNEYKESLDSKIKSANDFIEMQITPEIDNIFDRIDEQLHKLIDEVVTKQNVTETEIQNNKKKQIELENSMMLRTMLFPLKIIALSLGALGPIGAGAGAVLGGATMIAESLLLDDTSGQGNDKIGVLSSALRSSVAKISEQFKNKQQVFKDQLNDIDHNLNIYCKTDSCTDLNEIRQKVTDLKSKINEEMKRGATFDPAATDRLYEMRGELKELLTNKKTNLEQEKPQVEKKSEQKVRIVNDALTVVSLTEVSIDFYNRIRNDKAKIQKVNEAMQSLEEQLSLLKKYEQSISNEMAPQFREIENTVNDMSRNLNGKSHIQLDIHRWNIQSSLRDAKVHFHQMTNAFTVHDDLQRCIEKLDEGMAILIDVYDRIDSYTENAKLAAYISDIGSSKSKEIVINDTELNEAVTSLKQIIHSNLVLQQFEAAMHAFKQHYFPFAYVHLARYDLPQNLQFNDPETLIQNAIERIDDLKFQIEHSRISIGKYDRYIFSDIEFTSKTRHSSPFYTWEYGQIKNEIVKLLQGEEVTIKADITKGVNKNAVKFNEIGIHLKSENESLQNELEAELESFRVVMTLVGNNYYRCHNRYYYISVDDNIVIDCSLQKGVNGKPTYCNLVYNKISQNDYFLSPYAMWSIKLTSVNDDFSRLYAFRDKAINLELIGRGQYLDQVKDQLSVMTEICDEKLDKYYNFDYTISEADNIKFMKMNNHNLL